LGLIKYWKGSHLVHADPRLVSEHAAKYAAQRPPLEIDPACLHWQPLLPLAAGAGGRKQRP
jgi:histone acetyltransferase MYST1